MSLGKLLDPAVYGVEEYVIVCLVCFILFVTAKHIIFHTLYFWWYGEGRLCVPTVFWNLVTGKSLPERMYTYIKGNSAGRVSTEEILDRTEEYCSKKEFALTLGHQKGEVLEKVVRESEPEKILVCGAVCGYSILRILRSASGTAKLFLVEPDTKSCSVTKSLCEMAGYADQVTVIASNILEELPKLVENYDCREFDFVLLTSTMKGKPYYDKAVRLLEECHMLRSTSADHLGTVILADKVVHFGESEFLKHVRYSDRYRTQYYQLPLEYSPSDIIDGMEKAIYV